MDPIADMFSQIKNAQNARKENLTVSFSKMKMAILGILKERQVIKDYRLAEKKVVLKTESKETKSYNKIEIDLTDGGVMDIRRVSRPGRRVYASSTDIPWPKRRKALIIVSTSAGVLEGETARKKGLGGEVIAEVR